MATFEQFLNTFDIDNDSKGKQFEKFLKWYFQNHPKWSNLFEKVWLWADEDNPYRWQEQDLGTDLIATTYTGEVWAIQSKCYNPEISLGLHQFSTFLSDTSRKEIDKRLLVSTTKSISNNAKKTLRGQEKPIITLLYDEFTDSGFNYPNSYHDLKEPYKRKELSPRPYQEKAIEDVYKGFRDSDRGQLIMACGTGKTYTTLWIKEALNSKTTLILLPSLSLLSQTLEEWYKAFKSPFEALCVCSDSTVTSRVDGLVETVSDIHFPTTTDPGIIKKFLNRDVQKVVFSTYQSSPMIAEVFKDFKVKPFDLAIADEAHRCTGDTTSAFTTIIDQNRIKANKRLFTTATPKTFGLYAHKKAESRDIEIADMNDESKFGNVFHKLLFSDAINYKPEPLLNDYRVVVIGVTEPMVADLIRERELFKLNNNEVIDAKSLASQIGLLKAIKKYNLSKMITFHSRVSIADKFATTLTDALELVPESEKISKRLTAEMVSGRTPTSVRNMKLKQLKNAQDDEIRILSNARCLSEGVDVPSLDSVAFINPRKSQVDIIQGVGRAIRKSSSTKLGYIVLPIFIEDEDLVEETINKTKFKPIWDILNALKSHDETLEIQLNELRTSMGKEGISFDNDNLLEKIYFDLPIEVSEEFTNSLKTLVVNRASDTWSFWYGKIQQYFEKHQSSIILREDEDISRWATTQRKEYREGLLTDEKIQKLNDLEFWSWNPNEDRIEQALKILRDYKKEHGDLLVPASHIVDEFLIGQWISGKRSRKEFIEPYLLAELNSLGMVWNVKDAYWLEQYQKLKKYLENNNNSYPTVFSNKNGKRIANQLGGWLNHQKNHGKEDLKDDFVRLLEELPDWRWDKWHDEVFEKTMIYLNEYCKTDDIKEIKKNYKHPDRFNIGKDGEFSLGRSVQRMKTDYKQDILIDEKIKILESVEGWSWKTKKELVWDKTFELVREYALENKTTHVKDKQKFNGVNIASWIYRQKKAYLQGDLSEKQIQLLESVEGWFWENLKDNTWYDSFAKVAEYAKDNKTTHVKDKQKFKGVNIASWMYLQKKAHSEKKLSKEKIKLLESIDEWFWELQLDSDWFENFENYSEYVEENKTTSITYHIKFKGKLTGSWVWRQKKAYSNKKLSEEKIKILESVEGWTWKNETELVWNKTFELVREYIQENKTAYVQEKQKYEGVKIGSWIYRQKKAYLKGDLSDKQIQLLESVEGWFWRNKKDNTWFENFKNYSEYVEENKTTSITYQIKFKGKPTGSWVWRQKKAYSNKKLSEEKIKILESINDWSW